MDATLKENSISYLIIGSGRVARHLQNYFQLLDLNFKTWHRSLEDQELQQKISTSSHVLMAITDDAIENFYKEKLYGRGKKVVHFSGASHFSEISSAHPLMTFGNQLYDLEFYRKIHFVVTGAQKLQELIPGLPNSSSQLSENEKAKYHALCVLGGNFVTLLIAKMLSEFENFHIPHGASKLYVEKIIENTIQSPHNALTGPLVRKDIQTVNKNLAALGGDPSREIYKAFLNAYWPDFPKK